MLFNRLHIHNELKKKKKREGLVIKALNLFTNQNKENTEHPSMKIITFLRVSEGMNNSLLQQLLMLSLAQSQI